MEIIRRDELQELLDVVRMKPYGKILITGAAGSGKTFLLNIIGSNGVQGVQTRLKRKDRFESK